MEYLCKYNFSSQINSHGDLQLTDVRIEDTGIYILNDKRNRTAYEYIIVVYKPQQQFIKVHVTYDNKEKCNSTMIQRCTIPIKDTVCRRDYRFGCRYFASSCGEIDGLLHFNFEVHYEGFVAYACDHSCRTHVIAEQLNIHFGYIMQVIFSDSIVYNSINEVSTSRTMKTECERKFRLIEKMCIPENKLNLVSTLAKVPRNDAVVPTESHTQLCNTLVIVVAITVLLVVIVIILLYSWCKNRKQLKKAKRGRNIPTK